MNQRASRIVSLFASMVLLVTVFAGCSSGSSSQTGASTSTPAASAGQSAQGGDASAAPAKKVELTLMIGSTGTSLEAAKAVAAAAEKKLNISIKFDVKPDGTEGDNLVKTRLATSDMDDILFYNSGSLFQALNPTENFVDLTNEPFMSDVLDSFKKTVTADGKVYGVPGGSTNVGAILYNKKVYADLGLSVPKTWKEFMDNSEKIKAAGKTPIIASYKATWSSQLFVLGSFYNVQAQDPNFAADYTANKAKFATTPSALRGFEMTQEPFKKGYYNKDFLATTYDAALKMLADGTGVQYPMLSSALDAIYQNSPDKIKDIGVFPIPSDSADINGLTVWMPSSFYIYNKGKHIDAAKKWIEFYLSPEGQAAFASASKAVGPYVVKGAKLPDDAYPALKDMQPYFDSGHTAPALEFISPVKGPNLENITVECGSGQKTPLECAKEYDKDVQKQAQQLNLPGW